MIWLYTLGWESETFSPSSEILVELLTNNALVLAVLLFIEKVLLYIWDDVAKIDPTLWFDDINSFDELVDEYYDMNLRVFRELFKDQQLNESQDNNEEN